MAPPYPERPIAEIARKRGRGTNMADKSSSSGVGFTGALTLLFIGLKLGNVITWSWLWVLSPFWIPAVLLFVSGLILVIIRHFT